jgi:putative endonuclease
MLSGMSELAARRGMASEDLAAEYLQARGLKIIARNMRCKMGELDLICLDHEVLAVIEVRQRGLRRFGGAIGSVTRHKQRKIIRAARFFLRGHAQWRKHAVRFDVFAVEGSPDGAHHIVWVQDAFREDRSGAT